MSAGEVKATSQPVRTGITWTARISSIVIAGVLALQQAGVVTPQNAATIKTVTDQITPIADKIEQSINDKKLPDAATLVDLANQVKRLVEQLKPIPEPTPVVDPRDQQIKDLHDRIEQLIKPPAPVPVPTPIATDLKIVDSSGKEIANPIGSGKQVKVIASGAGKWLIQTESPADDYDVFEYPDHLICTLRNGAKLAVSHATESPLSVTGILVRCQDAPRPPPEPIDPKPDDKTVKHTVGGVYLVWEPSTVTADQSIVINDQAFWAKVRASGVTAYTYLPTTADELGKWTLEQMKAKGIPPPAIVLVDKDRFLIDVVRLPGSVGEIERLMGR